MEPLSPVAIALGAAAVVGWLWRSFIDYRHGRAIGQVRQQVGEISRVVAPRDEIPDIDKLLNETFELLTGNPSEVLYKKVIELLNKKREVLMGGLEFKDGADFLLKYKAIAEQFDEMLAKVNAILQEKGVQEAQVQAQRAPEPTQAAPKHAQVDVVGKKSGFCC